MQILNLEIFHSLGRELYACSVERLTLKMLDSIADVYRPSPPGRVGQSVRAKVAELT